VTTSYLLVRYLTEELLRVVIVHLWWPGRRLMHQALDVAFNVPYLKSSINCSTLVRRTDLAASKNVAGSFDKELVSRCRTISASLLIGTLVKASRQHTEVQADTGLEPTLVPNGALVREVIVFRVETRTPELVTYQ
jgi:hypothetical protein